jgi:hypothetical protein
MTVGVIVSSDEEINSIPVVNPEARATAVKFHYSVTKGRLNYPRWAPTVLNSRP